MTRKQTTTKQVKANAKTNGKAIASSLNWITSAPSPTKPFISIDKQERIYLNVASQTLLDGTKKIIVGYDAVTASLHIVDASKHAIPGVIPFKLDARNYAKATTLVENMRLTIDNLPVHFDYVGENETEGITSHVFKRRA